MRLKWSVILLAIFLVQGACKAFLMSGEDIVREFKTQKEISEPHIDDILIDAGKKVVLPLSREIKDPNMTRRAYAISALGKIGDERAIPSLLVVAEQRNDNPWHRLLAIQAIAAIDADKGLRLAKERKLETQPDDFTDQYTTISYNRKKLSVSKEQSYEHYLSELDKVIEEIQESGSYKMEEEPEGHFRKWF